LIHALTLSSVGIRFVPDQEGAAGMLARELKDEVCIAFDTAGAAKIHGEIDERRTGRRAFAAFPQLLEFLGNLADFNRDAEGGGIEIQGM
jgi:hypothetical protein